MPTSGTADPARSQEDVLDTDVERVARQLAAAGEGEEVGAFHLGWWSERMLAWAFTHPEFKTQLFRLVDVFPSCRDADDVLRHLSEYFDGVPVPRAVELGLDLAEHVPFGDAVVGGRRPAQRPPHGAAVHRRRRPERGNGECSRSCGSAARR